MAEGLLDFARLMLSRVDVSLQKQHKLSSCKAYASPISSLLNLAGTITTATAAVHETPTTDSSYQAKPAQDRLPFIGILATTSVAEGGSMQTAQPSWITNKAVST